MIVILAVMCFVVSGCAVLSLPFQAVGMVFQLVGEAFKLAQSLPMPPPGVFF